MRTPLAPETQQHLNSMLDTHLRTAGGRVPIADTLGSAATVASLLDSGFYHPLSEDRRELIEQVIAYQRHFVMPHGDRAEKADRAAAIIARLVKHLA